MNTRGIIRWRTRNPRSSTATNVKTSGTRRSRGLNVECWKIRDRRKKKLGNEDDTNCATRATFLFARVPREEDSIRQVSESSFQLYESSSFKTRGVEKFRI